MKCLKCGHNNKDDAKFCEKCGNQLKQTKESPRNTFWGKLNKNTKVMLFTAGIVFIILIFVSASYSYHYPNEKQYQDEVSHWKSDLDSATQTGSEGLEDGTDSDYVALYNQVANNLNDIENDINETHPPKGYETYHSYLLNEVDNFKMAYQTKAMSKKTGEKEGDDPQLEKSIG